MILMALCEELYSQHAAPYTVSQNTREGTKLRTCEQEQHSVPWKYRDLERAPADIWGTFCRLPLCNVQLQVKISKDEHLSVHFIQSQGQTWSASMAWACIPGAGWLTGKRRPSHIKYDRQPPAKDSHIKPDIMTPRCGMLSVLSVTEVPSRQSFLLAKACKDLVLLPNGSFQEVTAIINKLFHVLKIKANLVDGREGIDKIIKFDQSELKKSQKNSLKYLFGMSELEKNSEWVYWPLTPKNMQPHQIILLNKGFPFLVRETTKASIAFSCVFSSYWEHKTFSFHEALQTGR